MQGCSAQYPDQGKTLATEKAHTLVVTPFMFSRTVTKVSSGLAQQLA